MSSVDSAAAAFVVIAAIVFACWWVLVMVDPTKHPRVLGLRSSYLRAARGLPPWGDRGLPAMPFMAAFLGLLGVGAWIAGGLATLSPSNLGDDIFFLSLIPGAIAMSFIVYLPRWAEPYWHRVARRGTNA